MNKIIVYEKPGSDGEIAIVRPCPWARLVSSLTISGRTQNYSPPQRLERITNVRSIDLYNKMLDDIDDGLIQITWETEDAFCQRIIDEQTPELETAEQAAARVTRATRNIDKSPFRRPTGNLISKIIPAGATPEIVSANTIPTDRSLRRAFRAQGGALMVDMNVAESLGLVANSVPIVEIS